MRKMIFDRLARYRIAALILAVPIIRNVLTDAPITWVRVVYWIGLSVLLFSIVSDFLVVREGRKRVRALIKARQSTDVT